MRALPLDIGLIHFVGIGGIGMSGIAEVLHNLGYKVQGSDLAEGANTRRLSELGIKVSIGHRADNLGNAQVVVVSSAVKKDNPEVLAARARLVPVVRRAEMLGELMRLKWSVAIGGTHGKTTTTSMVASMLDAGGLDPTVINGGIINAYGTNARIGAGDWMVVESDESDGSFLRLPATIAIVTNVDPEHLDHYGTFDALRDAFVRFVENIPFYGFAVLCVDHPEVQALIPRVADRRIVTYGLGNNADVRAINVRLDRGGADFDVQVENRATNQSRVIVDLRLPMFGQHNVQNALAAIAVANEMGLPDETIRRALAGFAGVKRRFTKTGEAHGITVIDDYGHHPVEIAATLRAARQSYGGSGRVIAVMQPHRYTRLAGLREDFATCFSDADSVIIADVYAAGEAPIEGINRDMLVGLVQRAGHRDVSALAGPADLPAMIWRIARPGDVVVCLGAGNITAWAAALPGQLQQLAQQHASPRAVANDHSPGHSPGGTAA
jgi:UDP-N-acetylmuramate--alanine ligase